MHNKRVEIAPLLIPPLPPPSSSSSPPFFSSPPSHLLRQRTANNSHANGSCLPLPLNSGDSFNASNSYKFVAFSSSNFNLSHLTFFLLPHHGQLPRCFLRPSAKDSVHPLLSVSRDSSLDFSHRHLGLRGFLTHFSTIFFLKTAHGVEGNTRFTNVLLHQTQPIFYARDPVPDLPQRHRTRGQQQHDRLFVWRRRRQSQRDENDSHGSGW